MLKFINIFLIILLLVANVYAQDNNVRKESFIKIYWTYIPPPDMDVYEIKCSPYDEDAVAVPYKDVVPLDNDEYYWCGYLTVEIDADFKTYCYIRAVDLAGQHSDWAGPAVRVIVPKVNINNFIDW